MKFNKSEIVARWSDGKPILIAGRNYRVGRMSYGDYFLEPGRPRRETDGFHKDTIWLEQLDPKKPVMTVDPLSGYYNG